ncbi:MAG: SGNH/GDSL hydrolase family protein [Candidatus Micrarchaeota archaeon]
MQILVFGDCNVYGKWDVQGGWVQRMKSFLDEKHLAANAGDLSALNGEYCFVYSVGVDGEKTSDLLERFEFEARQRVKRGGETIAVFELGVADSQFVQSKNALRTPPEKFAENLRKLAGASKKMGFKTVFVGLTPVDERKTSPLAWNKDKHYKNEYVKKYDELLQKTCKQNKVSYIKLYDKITYADLQDGLHPNSKGHEKIFQTVKKQLTENKLI